MEAPKFYPLKPYNPKPKKSKHQILRSSTSRKREKNVHPRITKQLRSHKDFPLVYKQKILLRMLEGENPMSIAKSEGIPVGKLRKWLDESESLLAERTDALEIENLMFPPRDKDYTRRVAKQEALFLLKSHPALAERIRAAADYYKPRASDLFMLFTTGYLDRVVMTPRTSQLLDGIGVMSLFRFRLKRYEALTELRRYYNFDRDMSVRDYKIAKAELNGYDPAMKIVRLQSPVKAPDGLLGEMTLECFTECMKILGIEGFNLHA